MHSPRRTPPPLTLLFFCGLLAFTGAGLAAEAAGKISRVWSRGRREDPDFFPIAVWLQDPSNAERYRAAGINLYLGLWEGPNAAQLAALEKARMPVICAQNDFALQHLDSSIIVGWMHDDEPDNAQTLGAGKGYGPPISPGKIVADYQRMHTADPSRPVWLNLGQAVAWDHYIGRGVRRDHPEDYPQYIQGCDYVSFDIYPVVHEAPEIAGKLEFVAHGVQRLRQWSAGPKRVWNCIECTHIGNPDLKATPAQIRAEVWMSLIRGSQGLIYFVHQFKPAFREAALLEDSTTLAAVTEINAQIRQLAPILNSPAQNELIKVELPDPAAEIAATARVYQGSTYLFTANLRPNQAHPTFRLTQNSAALTQASLLERGPSLPIASDSFSDTFQPYEVRLYKLHP